MKTIITFSNNWEGKKILVAFGLDSKRLFKYDDYENISAIIAHQWHQNGVTEWAKNWGAINLNTGEKMPTFSTPDEVVQNAFQDLSRFINFSTGISHPSDEERCKTYIRALIKYDFNLNPQEIYYYLTNKLNWESYHAKEVRDLIDKVNSGKRFVGGEKTGLKKYIDKWKG